MDIVVVVTTLLAWSGICVTVSGTIKVLILVDFERDALR